MLIIFFLILLPCQYLAKWQEIFIQPMDIFADDNFEIHTMEIKCLENEVTSTSNIIAIDTRKNQYGKFVGRAKDTSGILFSDFVEQIAKKHFLSPSNCSQYFDWSIELEDDHQCFHVHAIFPIKFASKEEMAGICAWILNLANQNIDKWIGTYFPNSAFLKALHYMDFRFFPWEMEIYPKDYVQYNPLDHLPAEELNKENIFDYYMEMMIQTSIQKENNFDNYAQFLTKHIMAERIKIHGRMEFSKYLLPFIESGNVTSLMIDRAVGNWPGTFFDQLIQKIENGYFGDKKFEHFYFHMDTDFQVRWPVMSKFKLIENKRMISEFGSIIIYELHSGAAVHWRMVMSSLSEQPFEGFVNFEIFAI